MSLDNAKNIMRWPYCEEFSLRINENLWQRISVRDDKHQTIDWTKVNFSSIIGGELFELIR